MSVDVRRSGYGEARLGGRKPHAGRTPLSLHGTGVGRGVLWLTCDDTIVGVTKDGVFVSRGGLLVVRPLGRGRHRG